MLTLTFAFRTTGQLETPSSTVRQDHDREDQRDNRYPGGTLGETERTDSTTRSEEKQYQPSGPPTGSP